MATARGARLGNVVTARRAKPVRRRATAARSGGGRPNPARWARIPDEGQGRHDAAIPELVAGDGADREVQVQLVAGDGASVSATAQEEGMSRAQYEKVVGC